MGLAKDLVQDVFIKIWEQKPEFKNHNAIKGYFYAAVKNKCLDYLRSKYNRISQQTTSIDLLQIETEDHFLSQVATIEIYAQLYKAIDTLPEKSKKVIKLSLNNYSTNEIAEKLSIKPSTVRSHKDTAHYKLRKLLGNINQFFALF